MHLEYAVEPEAVGADWNTFKYIIEKFGFENGRLISRLPAAWEKEVVMAAKNAGVSEICVASMIERLRRSKKARTANFGRQYDPSRPWIDNALSEHEKRPFRAIICVTKPDDCEDAIAVNDCDEEDPKMLAPISRDVVRVAEAISAAIFPLVASSEEVDIVDPFFDIRPQKGDFMGPIASLLIKLETAGLTGKTVRIHFRTHDSRPPDHILARDAPRLIGGLIPSSFKLQLYEWEEIAGGEDFHDRFVLTNSGGLMVGAGLAAEGPDETATITLLANTHAQALRSRFARNSTTYKLIGSVVQIDSDGNAVLL